MQEKLEEFERQRQQEAAEMIERDVPDEPGVGEVDHRLQAAVHHEREREPGDCPAYTGLHRLYNTPEELAWQEQGCRSASIGCLECKKVTIAHVLRELGPVRERRARLRADDAWQALAAGNARARAIAERTMAEVFRQAVGLA